MIQENIGDVLGIGLCAVFIALAFRQILRRPTSRVPPAEMAVWDPGEDDDAPR